MTNPRPFMEPLNAGANAGFNKFQQVGCADGHRPVMQTDSRYLPLAHPEDPTDPSANVYTYRDLVEVGFAPAMAGSTCLCLLI